MAITTKQQRLGSFKDLAAALIKSPSSLVPGRRGTSQSKQSDMFADFYKLLAATGSCSLLLLGSGTTVSANGLDDHYWEISKFGGLAGLCREKPQIQECALGIGDWKPALLEKVKASSPFCIEDCGLDSFGFVQRSSGGREFPVVVTKDFDPSKPSKGINFSLFPVAIEVYKYTGCTGCPHIKKFPTSAVAILGAQRINLPLLGRGVFYLPSSFRRYLLKSLVDDRKVGIEIGEDESKEIGSISGKAASEYAKMLKALSYHLVR